MTAYRKRNDHEHSHAQNRYAVVPVAARFGDAARGVQLAGDFNS